MDMTAIQERLISLGYNLGPAGADGIRGAMTDQAIRKFQRRKGLNGTGQIGPKTIGFLFPERKDPPVRLDAFPWFDEARRMMGTREISGKRHSRTIMGWAERLGIWYPDDETPWCGLFVAHCIQSTLPNEPMPANALGARNWQKFGVPCSVPAVGAIVVFWRGKRSGWKGHVGFVAGFGNGTVNCLGGNQSNEVNVRSFGTDRVLGYRWPATFPFSNVRLANAGNVQRTDGNEA